MQIELQQSNNEYLAKHGLRDIFSLLVTDGKSHPSIFCCFNDFEYVSYMCLVHSACRQGVCIEKTNEILHSCFYALTCPRRCVKHNTALITRPDSVVDRFIEVLIEEAR